MINLTHAGQQLSEFVDLLRIRGGLNLTARIHYPAANERPGRPEPSPETSPGPDAVSVHPAGPPDVVVELRGPDAPLLTARNGELLFAIEHLAAKIMGLGPEEQDRISFDAGNFKAKRERELRRLASDAVLRVKTTATAYVFPPMMSRERRILHLALASSGLRTASSGGSFQRSVVLYPEGVQPPTG